MPEGSYSQMFWKQDCSRRQAMPAERAGTGWREPSRKTQFLGRLPMFKTNLLFTKG